MKKTVKLPVVWMRSVAMRLSRMLPLVLLIGGMAGFSLGLVSADDVGIDTFIANLQDESAPTEKGDEAQGDQVEEPRGVRDESSGIDPANKDALAWYMSGHKALKRGDLAGAADAFRKSAAADEKSAIPVRALAMVLFRMGNAKDGLSTAQQAMQMDADDWQTRLELAVALGQNGRFGQSLELLEQALASKTLNRKSLEFLQCHQVRAAVLLQMRNLGGSADSYEIILKALEKPEEFGLTDRDHSNLLKNKATGYETVGRVLLEAGRVPQAIQAFETLIRIERDVPGEQHLLLARALYQQDKLEGCEKNLNRYFEGGQRSKESLMLLRDLYENSSRSDALAGRLEELVKGATRPADVQMFLGQLLLDQGKPKEAGKVYQTILDSSGEAEAHTGLVRVAIAERDATSLLNMLNQAARARITPAELVPLIPAMTAAEEFSRTALKECLKRYEENPGDLDPLVTWFCAGVAGELELTDDQASLLQATLELEPDRELMLDTLDKYGVSQLQKGDFEMAARVFEQMLAQPGLPPGVRVNTLYRIAIAYGALKDLKAARRVINEALQLVPDEPQLLARLAVIEAMDGKLEISEGLLIRAIAGLQAPDKLEQLIEVRIQLAGIYVQMDRWDNAVEQYQTVLEMEKVPAPTLRLVRMGLSNALVQSGEMVKGEKILEDVYNEDPSDPGVNNDLGYLYADQGKNLEQAEKMIRIAIGAQPENSAYLDSLGWVLFRQGKNEEALEALKKANSDPSYQDSTLLEHQGDVHEALKQISEARDCWKRSLEQEEKASKPDEAIVERLKGKLKKVE
jgi:tetratricopeptide (TPR) repeat protein